VETSETMVDSETSSFDYDESNDYQARLCATIFEVFIDEVEM